MEVFVLSVLVLLCTVWVTESARTAQIAAIITNMNTGMVFNTSYYFGLYGRSSAEDSVSGRLVHVRSEGNVNNGCGEYNHDLPNDDWVALIERGQCYFTQKIRVATKDYNASAVIVYDNEATVHLVSMESYVKDEVYVFVKRSFGRRLVLLADSGLHVRVNITSLDTSSARLTASLAVLCWLALLLGLATIWL